MTMDGTRPTRNSEYIAPTNTLHQSLCGINNYLTIEDGAQEKLYEYKFEGYRRTDTGLPQAAVLPQVKMAPDRKAINY